MIHYFSDVGIWASLGKDENVIQGLTRKCIALLYKCNSGPNTKMYSAAIQSRDDESGVV